MSSALLKAGAAALLLGLTAWTAPVASSRAATTARLTSLLSVGRGGSSGAVTFEVRFSDSDTAIPEPVRVATLSLPAGLSLQVPHLSACEPRLLAAHGPGRCPDASLLGRGRALVEGRAGSQVISEHISLWAFLGPLHDLQPTVEILARGHTPFDKSTVLGGLVQAPEGSRGEQLVLRIPPVRTLPLEPDASVSTMALTIGAVPGRPRRNGNAVKVPRSCPRGGFPVAGEFVYADGSTSSAQTTIPCPR